MDVLEQLAAMGHEVPKLLIEYRELAKLKSTYVDALPGYIHPDTGRIHTSFNQVGAATGRLSSADPNLQNIPVRTERGESIRRAFIAPPGCRLLVADYSQIELRLLAHFSGDPAFVEAFAQGGDIHRQTAAVIFGVPQDQVTGDMRSRAKTINFATIYGQGPFALSRQLGISQDEAKAFIRQYFERFAGVRAWLDRTVARGARARVRRDHLRPTPLHPRAQGQELQHPCIRRAHSDELPAPGVGRGPHQGRHDPHPRVVAHRAAGDPAAAPGAR